MLGYKADKIFKIKKVRGGYEIYIADYKHPQGKVSKYKKCTKRSSLCGAINYIVKKSGVDTKEYSEIDILKGYVCYASREDYLAKVYNIKL